MASMDNSSNNNINHHHRNDPKINDVKNLCQQMQKLHNLDVSRNELKTTIADTFIKESKISVACTVPFILNIIETHWKTPNAVKYGSQMLKDIVEIIMQAMIQPQNYKNSIRAYISWQNGTVKDFIDRQKDDNKVSLRIKQAWDLNEQSNDGIFLGGAARPLFPEKITRFSDLLSSYYNKLDPLYVQNRSILFNVLCELVCEEADKYWKNYELFPSTSTTSVIEKCLHFFYFRDRNNTYFINSSGSDYIPFVHLAQKIFDNNKFIGSPMTNPDDHNTEWILTKLIEQCTNICNEPDQSNPIIIILLTSKNRFGARIDVDRIHRKLVEKFPGKIVTIVDACQDGQSFEYVDIILYSKRFTQTGAVCLINKGLTEKYGRLKQSMAMVTSFPISILAQLYANINMINEDIAFGIEDLVNSANWYCYNSPVLNELKLAFESYSQTENSVSSIKITKNDIQFEFTEDEKGTIVMVRMLNRENEDELLSHLMSKLKDEGHTLDSFLMNDPLIESSNVINTKQVKELIENKDLHQLRAIEARCNAHLAWPLVPFSVVKSFDDLLNKEHFNRCQTYHRCLRISIDLSGHCGKLKRFIDTLQRIAEQIKVKDAIAESSHFKSHSPQWPSSK